MSFLSKIKSILTTYSEKMNLGNIYSNVAQFQNPNILFNQQQLIQLNNNLKKREPTKTKTQQKKPLQIKNRVIKPEPPVIKNPESPSIPERPFINDDSLSIIKKVYIISKTDMFGSYVPTLGSYVGGSVRYLDDLKKHYKNVKFVHIKNKMSLLAIKNANPYDILFVQQLLFSDILPEDIINVKKKFGAQIVISIHDFCWFIEDNNIHNPTNSVWEQGYLYNNISKINSKIIQLFHEAAVVIHPSEFTQKHYRRFFPTHNSILEQHNDMEVNYSTKQIPNIENHTINIGFFQRLNPCKGKQNVELLYKNYNNTTYRGHKINFKIVGKNISEYDESNWQDEMRKHHFHCLLHLNKYGETYSYALSKSLNSGLPILYNNIGAFKERIPNTEEEDKRHYIKVIEHESEYEDKEILSKKFLEMLDYIIDHEKTPFTLGKNNVTVIYKNLYNYLFESREFNYEMNKKIHDKIKPFAIYFPQFHSLAENDLNYYRGMTDMTNLDSYNRNEMDKLDTPSLTELNLPSLLDYDLTKKEIITRQIDIAKQNGIYGFAIYYYWFSKNTITNKNTIMEKCYDLFFEQTNHDFKVFFVWANENWTDNVAFNTKEIIINEYNLDNFIKNIDHLMKYFKHPNYYKIDNKPVFYIHHPFLLDKEQLHLFNHLLQSHCLENGFAGSLLVLNNLAESYEDYDEYCFHPNYKKTQSFNYEEYIKTHLNNSQSTNTIFFDFNNTARLYIPNRTQFKSVYTNNSIYLQDKYIKKVLEQYKNTQLSELHKILLINSWNEWGENMAVEPGEMSGYKYLLLLKSNLLSFLF